MVEISEDAVPGVVTVTGSKFEGGSGEGLVLEGEGRYVFPNGTLYSGKFKESEFVGDGTFSFPKSGKC